MLYKKNNSKELDMELFRNPTSEYRAAPFWAWNCELDEKELLWQIGELKKMGFGGFHMHTRAGLSTEYLGKEFMNMIKACIKKAKEENMLAWLYDEDRWASGSAGGYVTGIKKYRQRVILFTVNERKDATDKELAIENGKPYLLNVFDVCLNNDGTLSSYDAISPKTEAKGVKWYAYSANLPEWGWYNGNTYVDSMNPEAMKKFTEVTHDVYYREVGEDFDGAVPAIFTDEPAHSDMDQLAFSHDTNDFTLSWTPDFDETFLSEYGFDIKEKLPELAWNLENNEISRARYCYHNHVSDRLVNAFLKTCGDWCRDHNLILTGHMAEEDSLLMQTRLVSEEMRAYPHFGIPGIDMLCDNIHLTTAKQAQSVVHQYGKEGMMTEHCGVTNWDYDFKSHKFHTDWQMALGVTARAHHLSWVSAKGSAKRDYPASMNYHSPWYREYPYIEDHCARLSTVLSRGTPDIKVGVIHPIESFWLYFGAQENNAAMQKKLEDNFQNVTRWLLFGMIDFDFISEALLRDIYGGSEKGIFNVGKMNYDAVIVPECVTLRKSTLEKLTEFKENGGKLIFMGQCPEYCDAIKNDSIRELYDKASKVAFDQNAIIDILSDYRTVSVKNSNGKETDNLIHCIRDDGKYKWLFIAHAKKNLFTAKPQHIKVTLRGEYECVLFDTLQGECCEITHHTSDGFTYFEYDLYDQDSLLIRLCEGNSRKEKNIQKKECVSVLDIKTSVEYKRSEDNVYILDIARYSLDGGEYEDYEEMLRIDKKLREKLGYPMANGEDVQPWVIKEEKPGHIVTLSFKINSEINVKKIDLAAEEIISAALNGKDVVLSDNGWYFDKSIRRYPLPEIPEGESELVVCVPFGKRVSLENMFILGDFDVRVSGCQSVITKKTSQISFGTITNQGMPFYGGNITYSFDIAAVSESMTVQVPKILGALAKVSIDGENKGVIACAPYKLQIDGIKAGKHKVELEFFGNRYNTFSALHNCGNITWPGPSMWYSEKENWCYEYVLKNTGIMQSPVIEFYR